MRYVYDTEIHKPLILVSDRLLQDEIDKQALDYDEDNEENLIDITRNSYDSLVLNIKKLNEALTNSESMELTYPIIQTINGELKKYGI